MSRLDFDWIELEGFRSFTRKTAFDLALGEGLHFIKGRNEAEPDLGSNGAGKSSLWGALSWCLYGKTVDGLRKGDVSPWQKDQTPIVSVAVTRNKKQRVVQRGVNGTMTIDDNPVGQEQIDKLLGMGFDVFTNTILLGQGRPLFFDLSPKDKLELFSTVLDLERWDARSEQAKDRVLKLDATVQENRGRLSGIEGEIAHLQQDITNLRERVAEWEENRRRASDAADNILSTLRKKLEVVSRKRDDADLRYDGAGTELKHINEQLYKLETDLQVLYKNQTDFLADEKQRERELARLRAELGNARHNCPTCGQVLPDRGMKVRNELKKKIERLEKHKGVPPITIQRIGQFEKQVALLKKSQLEFLQKQSDAQDELNRYGPEVAELTTKIKGIEKQQQEKQEENNPHYEALKDARRRKNKLEADATELKDETALHERRSVRAQFWVKGFKEVKLYQIEEVLQELDIVSNAMLEDTGLHGWSLKYAVERETKSGSIQRGLNVSVYSPRNDKPVKWEVWSGGECQRLRLIGSLALSETLLNYAGVDVGLRVLDEPTQHLSPEGIDQLCEFLADRANAIGCQIFYTDQHAVESSRFTSVTTVVKDKSGSRILNGVR